MCATENLQKGVLTKSNYDFQSYIERVFSESSVTGTERFFGDFFGLKEMQKVIVVELN